MLCWQKKQFFGATTQSSTVFESAANTSSGGIFGGSKTSASGIIEGGASSSKIFKSIRDLAKECECWSLNNEEKEEIEYVADDQAKETTFVLESPQLIQSPPCWPSKCPRPPLTQAPRSSCNHAPNSPPPVLWLLAMSGLWKYDDLSHRAAYENHPGAAYENHPRAAYENPPELPMDMSLLNLVISTIWRGL